MINVCETGAVSGGSFCWSPSPRLLEPLPPPGGAPPPACTSAVARLGSLFPSLTELLSAPPHSRSPSAGQQTMGASWSPSSVGPTHRGSELVQSWSGPPLSHCLHPQPGCCQRLPDQCGGAGFTWPCCSSGAEVRVHPHPHPTHNPNRPSLIRSVWWKLQFETCS